MGRVELFLADTSAVITIFGSPKLRERWRTQTAAGVIAICPAVELELGRGVRSVEDHETLSRSLREMFTWVPMDEKAWARAVEVQDSLIAMGAQGSASPIDLAIAATAEGQKLTLLHRDDDFDRIARITEQKVVRLDRP